MFCNDNQSIYYYSVLTGNYIPSTLIVDYCIFPTQKAEMLHLATKINGSFVVAPTILLPNNLPL